MANLLDGIVKIQACNQLEKGTAEYLRQSELAKKVREKFNLSRDLRKNIAILHTYQLNGLCLIDWNVWYNMLSIEQTKQLNVDTKEYIENIRDLNPEITEEIDKALGLKPRKLSAKTTKTESFEF